MNPPDNIINALRRFYKKHDPNQVPSDDALGKIASRYAGKEKSLWTNLYRNYEPDYTLTDENFDKLLNYENPYVKKKDGGIGSSPIKTTDAGVVGEGFMADSYDLSYDLNEQNLERLASLEDKIEQKKANSLSALETRKKAADISDESYQGQVKQIEDEYSYDLAKLNHQRDSEGDLSDQFKILEMKYLVGDADFDPLSKEKSAVFGEYKDLAAGTSVTDAISDYNRAFANWLGEDVGDKNSIAWAQQHEKRIRESEGDKHLLDKRREFIESEAGRILVESHKRINGKENLFTAKWIHNAISDTPIEEIGSWNHLYGSNKNKHPYSNLSTSVVDAIIDEQFSNLSEDDRQQIRENTISAIAAEENFTSARLRTEQTLEKTGILPPEEMIAVFEKERDKMTSDYAKRMSNYRNSLRTVSDKHQNLFSSWDSEFQAQKRDELEKLKAHLSEKLESGEIKQEDAEAAMGAKISEVNSYRQKIFNQHSANQSQEQNDMIAVMEQEHGSMIQDMEKMASKHGLTMDDGAFKVSSDYIDHYNRVFKTHLYDINDEHRKLSDAEYQKLNPWMKFSWAMTQGTFDMVKSIAGVSKWAGGYEFGNAMSDLVDYGTSDIPEPNLGEFSVASLGDPDWWFSRVARTLPMTMTLMEVGMAVYPLAASSAASVGVQSNTGRNIAASVMSAAAMRPLESLMEAGLAYEDIIDTGGTVEEAKDAAAFVGKNNMKLVVADALQMFMTFGFTPSKLVTTPGQRLAGRFKGMRWMGGLGLSFGVEGMEEVYQEYLQAKTHNPLITFMEFANSPAGKEVFTIGGIMGGGFYATGRGFGPKDGGISAINEAIQQHFSQMQEETITPEATKKRHLQLLNTLRMLEEKQAITQEEFQTGVEQLNHAFEVFGRRADLPMEWNSPQYREYVDLSYSVNATAKASIEMREEGRVELADRMDRQVAAMKNRLAELIQNPDTDVYAVNGVSVSEEDFYGIIRDDKFKGMMLGNAVLNTTNPTAKAEVALMYDNASMIEDSVNGLMQELEVSTAAEALEMVNQELENQANEDVSNNRDQVVELNIKKALLERHIAEPASVQEEKVTGLTEQYESGAITEQIETREGKTKVDYIADVIHNLEQEGNTDAATALREKYKTELSQFVEEEVVDNEFANKDIKTAGQEEVRQSERKNKLQTALADEGFSSQLENRDELAASLNQNVIPEEADSIIEQHEQYVEQNTEDVEQSDPVLEQEPDEVNEGREGQISSGEEVAVEDTTNEEVADQSQEEDTNDEVKLTDEEIAEIDQKIKEKWDSIKEWWMSQQNLGFAMTREQQFKQIDEDIQAFKDMVEIAYLHMKKGVKTVSYHASILGLEITPALRLAWDRASALHEAQTDKPLNYMNYLGRREAIVSLLQDKDVYIEVLQKRLAEVGYVIDDNNDLKMIKELQVSRSESAIQAFKEILLGEKSSKFGSTKKNKEAWLRRMNSDGVSVGEMSLYRYALHAPDFNARTKEMMERKVADRIAYLNDRIALRNRSKDIEERQNLINNNQPGYEMIEDGSGLTTEIAEEIVAEFQAQENFAAIEQYSKEFDELVIKPRIDLLESSGMISAEAAQNLRDGKREGYSSVFNNYVPLEVKERVYSDRTSPANVYNNEGRAGLIKQIKGTGRFSINDRYDPIMKAILNHAETIKAVERNNTARILQKLIESNKDESMWRVIPSSAKVEIGQSGDVTQTTDMVPQAIKENSVPVINDGKLSYLYLAPQQKEVVVWKGTEKTTTLDTVPNPLLTSMRSSTANHNAIIGSIYNFSRILINFKRNTTTVYNIAFGVPNFTRDVQEAMANITTDKEELGLKHVRRKILKNVAPAMATIARSPWENSGGRMAQYWAEAIKAGMPMSWANYEGVEYKMKELQKMASEATKGRSLGKKVFDNSIGVTLESLLYLNNIFENSTRLAVYAALRDSGVGIDRAANVSKNITLNFEKKGTGTNTLNALYLFANAGIQGVARGGKLLYSKKGRRVLGAVLGLSVLNSLLLDMWDDEDETDVYGDFDRDNNLLIANPFNKKEPFRLPKPYSFVRLFMNAGEVIYDVASEKTTPITGTLRMFSNLHTVVDPIGGASANKVSAYVPTMLKIPVEWMMNEKWSGNYFYSPYLEGKPDHLKKTKKTAKWATAITDFLNEKSNIFDAEEGLISISPVLLEYIWKDMVGGMGREIGNVSEMIGGDEGFDINKTPIARRFYVDLDKKEKTYLYRFYEIASRSNKDGITERELKIAREGFKLAVSRGMISPQFRNRVRKDFERKYKKKL